MKRLIVIAGIIAVSAGLAPAGDLKTYTALYEKELNDIALAHGVKMTDLGQLYTTALHSLVGQAKKLGDLNRTEATMNEMERFGREQAMPAELAASLDIKSIQTVYTKKAEAHKAARAKQLLLLLSKYDNALNRLQRELVMSGRLDEAKTVQGIRKKEAQSVSIVEARHALQARPDHAKPPASQHSAHQKDTLVLWNTHNGGYNDRGADRCNITVFNGNMTVWKKRNVPLTWKANTDTKDSFELPPRKYDRVKVEITKWIGQSGGLSEIQILRGGENIALGCDTETSDSLDRRLEPANITDGITTSKDLLKGYWLLPDNEKGWVEVTLAK